MENPDTSYNRLSLLYSSISTQISSSVAKPCFCTIAPMHIAEWNHLRLNQHKTSFLLHYHQYEDMQINIINAICLINRFIISLNISNQMFTPKIADDIITKKGSKRPTYRVQYNLLDDGCHPLPPINTSWAKALLHAVEKNRQDI